MLKDSEISQLWKHYARKILEIWSEMPNLKIKDQEAEKYIMNSTIIKTPTVTQLNSWSSPSKMHKIEFGVLDRSLDK